MKKRQIVNRFIRFAKGAAGPYARNIGKGKVARPVTKKSNQSPPGPPE